MSIEKVYYRPYLTGEELDAIVNLFSSQSHTEFINKMPLLNSYKKLNDLKEKKDRGQAFISHVTKGSLKEQLKQGLDLDGESKNKPVPLTAGQKMDRAWTKFQANPANCSKEELELVQDYRYLHGLMSEEEMEKYDSDRGLNF